MGSLALGADEHLEQEYAITHCAHGNACQSCRLDDPIVHAMLA